jgi:hypothetical protein
MSESRTELPATTGPYRVREHTVEGRSYVTVFAPTDGDDRVVWDRLSVGDPRRTGLWKRALFVADELNEHLGVSA